MGPALRQPVFFHGCVTAPTGFAFLGISHVIKLKIPWIAIELPISAI